MNFRVVFKLIGRILLLLAGSMVLPLVVALLYQECHPYGRHPEESSRGKG